MSSSIHGTVDAGMIFEVLWGWWIVDVIVERCTVSHYTRRHNLNDLELEVQIGWTDCASYIRCWYDVDVVYTPGDMNCFVVDAWPLWRHVEMGIVRSSSFALVSAVQLFPSNIMHGPPRTKKHKPLKKSKTSNSKNLYYQYHISIIVHQKPHHATRDIWPLKFHPAGAAVTAEAGESLRSRRQGHAARGEGTGRRHWHRALAELQKMIKILRRTKKNRN